MVTVAASEDAAALVGIVIAAMWRGEPVAIIASIALTVPLMVPR